MLDYLLTFALLFLIVSHALLIRGCFKINESIPNATDTIAMQFQPIQEVLTECLDCLDALASGDSNAQTPEPMNLSQLLLTGLMSKMNMGEADGSEKEQENRPIQEESETVESVQESD